MLEASVLETSRIVLSCNSMLVIVAAGSRVRISFGTVVEEGINSRVELLSGSLITHVKVFPLTGETLRFRTT